MIMGSSLTPAHLRIPGGFVKALRRGAAHDDKIAPTPRFWPEVKMQRGYFVSWPRYLLSI